MPRRSPLAEIGQSLRSSVNASVLIRALADTTSPAAVGPEAAQELLDAMTGYARALAGHLGAAKAAFKASKGNPALGGADDLVEAGGWADEAELELGALREAATRFAVAMSVAGLRPNMVTR